MPTQVICSVCRVPLNHKDTPKGPEYRHGYTPPEIPFHQPNPIVVDAEDEIRRICDFCWATEAERGELLVFPCQDFSKRVGTEMLNFVGDWTICPDCATSIPRREFTAPFARWRHNHPTMTMLTGKQINMMFEQFSELWNKALAMQLGPIAFADGVPVGKNVGFDLKENMIDGMMLPNGNARRVVISR